MKADYEELKDLDDEEEKLKKRLEIGRERSKAILSNQIKTSANYHSERLRCCAKLSFDFRNFINPLYSDNKTGVFFLVLFLCFIFFFAIVSVAVINHQFMFLLVPTLALFVYHFILEARAINLYGAAFFLIQIALQVTLLFKPTHGVIYGIVSLVVTVIHLVVKSRFPSLRFYLKVCIVYGLGYIGIGMKSLETFEVNDYFFLYYLILLSIFWIVLNKFTLLQLLFIWIPAAIKLFFKRTCCKPRPLFDLRAIYKRGDRYILKGNLTRAAVPHVLLLLGGLGGFSGDFPGRFEALRGSAGLHQDRRIRPVAVPLCAVLLQSAAIVHSGQKQGLHASVLVRIAQPALQKRGREVAGSEIFAVPNLPRKRSK